MAKKLSKTKKTTPKILSVFPTNKISISFSKLTKSDTKKQVRTGRRTSTLDIDSSCSGSKYVSRKQKMKRMLLVSKKTTKKKK